MATVHVDRQNGNDARTYAQAQSAATPWKTIQRSMNSGAESMLSGDLCLVQPGHYIEAPSLPADGRSLRRWLANGYVEIQTPVLMEFGNFNLAGGGDILEGFTITGVTIGGLLRLSGQGNKIKKCRVLGDGVGSNADCAIEFGGSGGANTCVGCSLEEVVAVIGSAAALNPALPGAIAISTNVTNPTITKSVGVSRNTVIGTSPAGLGFGGSGGGGTLTLIDSIFASTGLQVVLSNSSTWDNATFASKYVGNNNNLSKHLNGGANIANIGGSVKASLADWQAFVAPDDPAAGALATISGNPLWGAETHGGFVLLTGSPCLGTGSGGSNMGPYGLGLAEQHDGATVWGGGGSPFGWAFVGNAGLDGGTQRAIRTAAGTGEARKTLVLPVGKRVKRVGWREIGTNGSVGAVADAQIIDSTDFVAGSPNPRHMGIEENSNPAPTPAYVNREREQVFVGVNGDRAHLSFLLRDNGKVRS